MTDIPPGERAQLLRSIWAQDILPAVQLGVQPDGYAYLAKLSKYLDLPELQEIVKMTQEAVDPQERKAASGGFSKPGKPGGKYQRVNISAGMTPQAEQQQQSMMLMAGGE